MSRLARGDGDAVGVSDSADAGKAESVFLAVADPLGAELPERLECWSPCSVSA